MKMKRTVQVQKRAIRVQIRIVQVQKSRTQIKIDTKGVVTGYRSVMTPL